MKTLARHLWRKGWIGFGAALLLWSFVPDQALCTETAGKTHHQTQRAETARTQGRRSSSAVNRTRTTAPSNASRQKNAIRSEELATPVASVQADGPDPTEAPADPTGTSAPKDPASEAVPLRADDPVYKAWEAFLKDQASQQSSPQLEAAPTDAPDLAASARGKGVGGPWGSFAAAVFGGAGLLGAWAARKHASTLGNWLASRRGTATAAHKVQVLGVHPVSPHGSVAVISIQDEVLVLGVTSHQVSLLLRLGRSGADPRADRAETASPARGQGVPDESSPRASGDFADMLGSLMRGRPAEDLEAPVHRVNPSPVAQYAAQSAAKTAANIGTQGAARSATHSNSAVQGPLHAAPARTAGTATARAGGPAHPLEAGPDDMAGQVLRKMKSMRRFRVAE